MAFDANDLSPIESHVIDRTREGEIADFTPMVGPDGVNAFSKGFFEIAAAQNPKPQTVAILAADAEFARSAADGAREELKKHSFKVVYDQTYPPPTTDFAPVTPAIQAVTARANTTARTAEARTSCERRSLRRATARNSRTDSSLAAYLVLRKSASAADKRSPIISHAPLLPLRTHATAACSSLSISRRSSLSRLNQSWSTSQCRSRLSCAT